MQDSDSPGNDASFLASLKKTEQEQRKRVLKEYENATNKGWWRYSVISFCCEKDDYKPSVHDGMSFDQLLKEFQSGLIQRFTEKKYAPTEIIEYVRSAKTTYDFHQQMLQREQQKASAKAALTAAVKRQQEQLKASAKAARAAAAKRQQEQLKTQQAALKRQFQQADLKRQQERLKTQQADWKRQQERQKNLKRVTQRAQELEPETSQPPRKRARCAHRAAPSPSVEQSQQPTNPAESAPSSIELMMNGLQKQEHVQQQILKDLREQNKVQKQILDALKDIKQKQNENQEYIALLYSATEQKNPQPARPGRTQKQSAKQKTKRKACERCRKKKLKCEGGVPCKKCKESGVTCSRSHNVNDGN